MPQPETSQPQIQTWLASSVLHVYAEHQRHQPEPFRARAASALTQCAERLPNPLDVPTIERRDLRRSITTHAHDLDLAAARVVNRFKAGITARHKPYLRFGPYRGYEVNRGSMNTILGQWIVSHGDTNISAVMTRRPTSKPLFELACLRESNSRIYPDFRIVSPPDIPEFLDGKSDVTYELEYPEAIATIDSIIAYYEINRNRIETE